MDSVKAFSASAVPGFLPVLVFYVMDPSSQAIPSLSDYDFEEDSEAASCLLSLS